MAAWCKQRGARSAERVVRGVCGRGRARGEEGGEEEGEGEQPAQPAPLATQTNRAQPRPGGAKADGGRGAAEHGEAKRPRNGQGLTGSQVVR